MEKLITSKLVCEKCGSEDLEDLPLDVQSPGQEDLELAACFGCDSITKVKEVQ